jgi:hypothetical protein
MIPRRLVLVLALSLNLATGLLINNSQATIPNSTLVKLKIPSPERDFPIRTVYVWTPAVPVDQITVLPVVYMLHGWPGSPSGLMSAVIPQLTKAFAGVRRRLSQYSQMAIRFHILTQNGLIHTMVAQKLKLG